MTFCAKKKLKNPAFVEKTLTRRLHLLKVSSRMIFATNEDEHLLVHKLKKCLSRRQRH